jgi:hypothetical protein
MVSPIAFENTEHTEQYWQYSVQSAFEKLSIPTKANPWRQDTPPVLLAKAVTQPGMARGLREMGAKQIDPPETSVAEMFTSGEHPRPWKKTITYGYEATQTNKQQVYIMIEKYRPGF